MSLLGRCCYGVIFSYIVNGIVAYHFDTDNVILYEHATKTRGSYFGFSTALRDPAESEESTIFIGAPRANSSRDSNVNEPGAVFKCGIDSKSCEEWGPIGGLSNGSWLGGSLAVANTLDVQAVVICAPRSSEGSPIVNGILPMRGLCYVEMGEEIQPLIPLYSEPSTLGNFSYSLLGQSGFSIDVIPDQTLKYILGCPGMFVWQGIPILSQSVESSSFLIPNISLHQPETAHFYSGYAVTSGKYFSAERYYTTGAPRAAKLRGRVIVFKFQEDQHGSTIDRRTDVSGENIGEYFGSALASCDIDGDGRDELLVGAPQWTKNSDEGRIYVFKGQAAENFTNTQHIDGTTLKGRFGSAITCLGDIDNDNYEDVAVGAPYDGNGAVYIFHGSKDGLRSTQNISGPHGTRGFGISISKPVDIDENGYADIAVGAYLSGHVTLLRSKHVVSTNVTLSSSLLGKQLSRDAKSFTITVCSSYTAGIHALQSLNITRELKIREMHQRAYLNISGEHRLTYEFNDTLRSDEPNQCQPFKIDVKDMNEQFLYHLNISVTQRLNTNNKKGILRISMNGSTTGDEYFNASSAVTNELYQQDNLTLDFALDCGNGNECISNLSIDIDAANLTVSHYVIGSQSIKLDITVHNTGDPAYLASVVVSMPNFIKPSHFLSTCDNNNKGDETLVTCSTGHHLIKNATQKITLRLDMSSVPGTQEIILKAEAITQSNDKVTGGDATSLRINCVAEADIGIAGETNMDLHQYTLEGKEEQLPSIRLNHTYEMKSYESTPITEAVLEVSIPTHWIAGGNKIEVLKLNRTITTLDGGKFSCVDEEKNNVLSSYDAYTRTQWLIGDTSSPKLQAESKFKVINGKVFSACPDNRTLFINCTNPAFEWKTIVCKLGPFNSPQSTARLVLEFDLLLHNFTPEMIGDRNMIFFVTNSSTRITKPLGIAPNINKKPDSTLIGTRFIGSPSVHGKPAPRWILPLSVGVGLLLLILIIIGLLKFGFFKRDKKEKLDALKKEDENISPRVVIETTSSREALDTI